MSGPAAMAAARARARGGVLSEADATAVAPMVGSDGVWRLVRRGSGDRRIAVLTTPFEHAPVADDDHVSSLSSTRATVLLGVLAATREVDDPHPWPGGPSTVGAVLRLLGGARVPEGTRRHHLGAFKDLAAVGLVDLDGHDDSAPVVDGTVVRVGTAVAAWDGPWLAEVAGLCDRVVELRGRGAVHR